MNLRPQTREEPDISLTPLIDVVFLLLIFFMISTTFDRDAQLHIELPEASLQPEEVPDKILEIGIDVEGRYFVNQQEVVNNKIETLKRAIEQVLGEDRDLPVVIRADARTPHQAVIRAMDAASQLGLLQLSLATTPSHENQE